MIEQKYIDKVGQEISIQSEEGFTEDEMKYLINPNPFWNPFYPFEYFNPKIGEEFFLAELEVRGRSCAREYCINIIPFLERVTILEAGNKKRYKYAILEPSYKYETKPEGYEKYGFGLRDEYIISEDRIIPSDNVVCSCGCYNKNPIDEFPWDKNRGRYVLASSLIKLENNIEILMKDLDIFDVIALFENNLIERNKKIEEVICRNPNKYISKERK